MAYRSAASKIDKTLTTPPRPRPTIRANGGREPPRVPRKEVEMMAKKIVSLFVLAAFALFNLSCSSYSRSSGFLRIVNVITKTGESIVFTQKNPAHFLPGGDGVVGQTLQEFEFDKKDVKIFYKGKSGRISTIEAADGRTYKVLSSTEDADTVRISAYAQLTIPVSDIQQVWIRKANTAANAVMYTVMIGATLLLVAGIIALASIDCDSPEWESCPFVYSFNGEEYVLDA
jgi:hypothetical protein